MFVMIEFAITQSNNSWIPYFCYKMTSGMSIKTCYASVTFIFLGSILSLNDTLPCCRHKHSNLLVHACSFVFSCSTVANSYL